ncbi:MAG: hypothetical protein D4R64_07300 [Porphyromonadaceae bacterium]|nr:MAG: hypothetical protein D4R64_07300 [Porphyromonadaceae bacterium]
MKNLASFLIATLIFTTLQGQNNKTKSAVENVIIVYKTHFDIGYSSTVHDVVHEYHTEMVDRVLVAIGKNSHQSKENQFVWTVSGWPMKQMLWEGQAPERRQKIEQAIRDGSLVVNMEHGLPLMFWWEGPDGSRLLTLYNNSYGSNPLPPDNWPEAGWICLPFKIDNPKFRLGRLGADMDPVKDFKVDNSNYHMSWINTGVAIYDGNSGAGVGLCPEDSPVVSLGVPGEYQFDKRYEPSKSYIYINLYNNHWRTNFAAWIGNGERMSSRVRLWTYDQFNSESALYTPAMETRVPLKVGRSRSNPGTLPVTQSGITLSRKGVALTAFGPNPDGPGTILRVWEQGGITGNVEITLPTGSKFTSATPVNLRGEKIGEAVRIRNGKFSVSLKTYAPASFILGFSSN